MKANVKWTVLAMAVSALTLSAAASAADDQNQSADIDHQHNVNETRTSTNTNTNTNTWNSTYNTTTSNQTTDVNTDVDLKLDAAAKLRLDAAAKLRYDASETYSTEQSSVREDVQKTSNISANEKKEKDNHGVDVNLEKDLRLSSDIAFSGDPSITGSIDLDSAAIAVIDNRQSISGNAAVNDKLTNDASIGGDTASDASGNLGFNVASGDNNAQDNAAALSAADSSFAFGMADAEVFVNQSGTGNATLNQGVTNAASIQGSAFSNATGNIGANVASGNNNEQKNALSASVATSAYAQSSISSNQVSSGNVVSNAGKVERYTETTQVSMSGPVRGWTAAVGVGGYEGSTSGSTASRGNSYQSDNFYLDTWSGALPHANGNATGHIDMDNEIQNAVANPDKPGVGGIAFDNKSTGTYRGSEAGELGFVELGVADLYAQLSGTVATTRYVVVNATNTASLSGSAFSNASGNIGVNVASGTGNLQANSLALAVAQPSTGGGTPGGTE
ncbi:MAG TPA: adhesin [Xanthomonadaceae bacterium]|nr:adhesin [Xanthomonadaceae bacterium]